MPKNKTKKRGGAIGASKGPDGLAVPPQRLKNEEGGSGGDNWSTQSNASDDSSWHESDLSVKEEDGEEVSEQENFEDTFSEFLDGTLHKSAQSRIEALQGVQKCLQRKYFADFLMDRRETLADHLLKCLRKGKGEEVRLAAACTALAAVQLGQEAEGLFEITQPTLMTLLADNSTDYKARGMCAMSLAVCSLLCCDDIEKIKALTHLLEDIFSMGCAKRGNSPNMSPELNHLMSQALHAWSLMLYEVPEYQVYGHIDNHILLFHDLLQSSDLDLRIRTGEALAILYEMAREQDETFSHEDEEIVFDLLSQLSKESVKHKAKRDRRQQRSCFRDISKSVVDLEHPSEVIHIGKDTALELSAWSQKKLYESLCQVLMTGTSVHLKVNPLLRDMFDLGPPILDGQSQHKAMSKAQRNAIHATAFKLRTKARAKHRDKRSVAANGF